MTYYRLVALLLLVLVGLGAWLLPQRREFRGRVLQSKAKRATNPGRIWWGGSLLPFEAETTHFMMVGTSGSGKTLSMKRMMRAVLPDVGVVRDHRALIYDAKQDVLSFLSGLQLECPIVTLNPFDARGVAWDMARDIRTPSAARQLAKILVPGERGGGNQFFALGARDLLAEVVMTFIQRVPDAWTLRDLVLTSRSVDSLEAVLATTSSGQRLFESYFGDERTGRNVLATLRTRLAELEPVAALWSKSSLSVSLDEWAAGEFVLVLASDEKVRAALDTLNRLVFRRIVDLTLSRTESFERRSWFFLDEVREAGKLDGLSSLLTRGRSKGASAVLGFQDVEGLREAYGVHLANEVMAMCSNKSVLRIESPETAAWASKLMGEFERIELRESTSSGSFRNRYRTKSEQRVKTDAVLSSEFLSIPPTTLKTGLTGFYLSPSLGAYRDCSPLAGFIGETDGEADFVPRPSKDEWLVEWSEGDFERLGLALGDGLGVDGMRLRVVDALVDFDASVEI